jgi:hypothetical protein
MMIALLAALFAGGCQHSFGPPPERTQEVQGEPVSWSAIYDDKVDIIGRCLVTRAHMDSEGMNVALMDLDFGAGTARVITTRLKTPKIILGAYSLRRVGDRQTEVEWRQRGAPFGRLKSGDDAFAAWARRLATDCGKRYGQ